ncbi:MAG: cupredoxin domain-containing protein [Acidimicrobiales bacterium]
MGLRKVFAATVVILAAVALPVAGAGAGAQASAKVEVVNFDYMPRQLTVDANATVTFTNTGDRPHTVTDRGGTFDSQPIAPGATANVTFSVPGRYSYFCRINPSKMNGFIEVRPPAQAAEVNRVQAVDPGNIEGETLRFDPPNLTVQAGSTILFANVGGKPHTLTADDGSFGTDPVAPGAEGGRFAGNNATFTVTKPGTFAFHCEIHPQAMKGTLTVVGQARAAPPPAAASDAPRQASVEVVDFAFQPAQLSVAPGGQVRFDNKGAAPHTATLDDVAIDTKTIEPGANATLVAPDKPGSYSFRCTIHPAKMRGVLVVVGQSTADPTKSADANAPPPVAAARAGPGGRVSTLAVTTGVLAAFLGGLGIAPFLRRKATAKPKPTAEVAEPDVRA